MPCLLLPAVYTMPRRGAHSEQGKSASVEDADGVMAPRR